MEVKIKTLAIPKCLSWCTLATYAWVQPTYLCFFLLFFLHNLMPDESCGISTLQDAVK